MSNYPWYDEARKELGIREGRDDAEILKLFREAGHPEIGGSDTAWCAAFAGAMLQRAGYKPSGSLMARSYVGYGMHLGTPKIGCIAVLWRGSPHSSEGHVGFVNCFDDDTVALVGGNQGSSGVVSIECFPRSRVLCFRWPDGGPELGAKPGAESKKPLQNSSAPLGASGPGLAKKPTTAPNSAPTKSTKGTIRMNPLSILTSVITAVLPKDAPGTPAAGITTPIGAARSNMMSVILGALLAGAGSTGFGADAMHTISTVAGVMLAILSAVNHLGLIGANNANTEAYAEYLLKQIAEASPTPPTAPTA
jgi:uncharacterized protein (TIGR02594 family)